MDNSHLFFKAPATIKSLKTMSDRSYRLTVDTDQELNPMQAAELNAMLLISGTFGFVADEKQIDELDRLEVPEEVIEVEQKTKSQRLRAVMALVARQIGKDPEVYYRDEMEKVITFYKKKLNPKEQ